jgi:hypothetical protein
VVVWVRFSDSGDYFEWKQYILDLADPARDKAIEEASPNLVSAASPAGGGGRKKDRPSANGAADGTANGTANGASGEGAPTPEAGEGEGAGADGQHMTRALTHLVEVSGAAASNQAGAEDALWYHEAIVDLANSRSTAYLRQLEAQSASYIRESKSRMGWRWTAGSKEGTLTNAWRLSESSIPGEKRQEHSIA